mmetsp:Transcript_10945/g.23598  ORF Transcript_10945/g.23598 Transcript_10945/m.23598 type:complete len:769 (-) Transcript_10945:646-2952(-)|eukprot:CAMPEP_0202902556 /NCGR_PEP_ID=MMETSP1392-20130828/16922_1 /ASSEMBLY_ACC=CAM_ASM_000868 /TAXON_ID=225041 /ORGANISM="Chlamydomonas chlamydogama, Strain SAG 11-48b" /LENGTH=768 /DNA_ID=CAMNT_0049589335 /DNA_START=128 /DNA_END=2434 /DNA_ORIENTATION=+
MARPETDYAQNWLALFELFDSVSGLKLRLNIPDTAILRDGRIVGWFYTSKEGIVSRASNHEISPQALYQKLTGAQTKDPASNPFGYVAIGHYESGISRPLKQQELQQVLSQAASPYESAFQQDTGDLPFCLQGYIVPLRDMRYITAFGGPEGPISTTFGRRYSTRYTHAFDDSSYLANGAPGASFARAAATSAASAAASAAAAAAAASGEDDVPPLTAEEMLVESQLVALGLIEPRDVPTPDLMTAAVDGTGASDLTDPYLLNAGPDDAMPVPKRVKAEISRTVQTVASFVERAHGLRIQAMVAEFILAAHDTLVMLAVHAVQWDARSSRGRLGTFTDRWADFLTGLGPAPAVRPPTKRNFSPALFRTEPTLTSDRAQSAGSLGGTMGGNIHASIGGREPANVVAGLSGRGHPLFPANFQGNETTTVVSARPGSAPTAVMQRFRPNPYYPSPANGNYSQRNAVSAGRRGAGGNAVPVQPSPASYVLWTPREVLPTDSVTGSLALELELLKEKLQRQTDISARAEAALTQLAVSTQAQQGYLTSEAEELRAQLLAIKGGRKEMDAEYERVRSERQALKTENAQMQEELRTLRAALHEDRATLATTVRTSQQKHDTLEDELMRMRADNEALSSQVTSLQRRVEEDSEVIEAIKMQLVDYRQMVTMLQGQLRRGKNKPAAGGAGSPPGPTPGNGPLAGMWSGGGIPGKPFPEDGSADEQDAASGSSAMRPNTAALARRNMPAPSTAPASARTRPASAVGRSQGQAGQPPKR